MKKGIKLLLAIAMIGSLLLLGWAGLKIFYQGKFLPTAKVAGISISGLDSEKARERLENEIKELKNRPINFIYKNKTYQYHPDYNQIQFQVSQLIDRALISDRPQQILSSPQEIPVKISPKEKKEIVAFLKSNIEQKMKEEKIFFNRGQLDYQEAEPRVMIDRKKTILNIESSLGSLKTDVVLAYNEKYPQTKNTNLLLAYYQVSQLMNKTPIALTAGSRIVGQIDASDLVNWLELEKNSLKNDCKIINGCLITSYSQNLNQYSPGLNEKNIETWIDGLASEINTKPVNAKLHFDGSSLEIIKEAQFGYQLNKNNLRDKISSLIRNPTKSIELKVTTAKPEIHQGNVKNLGIRELIGRGETTFHGSSDNRIHNIKNGSKIVSGTLIKPGGIFSAVETIKEVERSNGFVPELVIKGDKTEKEVGGGLCQVSSTLFRAALNSGFEIVERHNHAYRVGYYEPPVGMDATVYIPWTDLKFKNNTGDWILIQYQMSDYQLAFNIYGTDDGRKISISNPKIDNITSPPKPTIIKDNKLKPGEKIVEEHAHQGADAWFKYRVTRDNEVLIDQTISSHYQAWPAKIRVGPDKKSNKKEKEANDEKKQGQ
jgi:vancomycin resistance protein YoaR